MANDFPRIPNSAWTKAIETGRNNAMNFIEAFGQQFNATPDERGLTDKFLLDLASGNAKMNFERYSQQKEGTTGCDYAFRFQFEEGKSGNWRDKIIFLQAKTYKPEGNPPAPVADFRYQNANGYQVELVDATMKAEKAKVDPTTVVMGGYLLYSSKKMQYVSTASIKSLISAAIQQGKNSDNEINKYVSRELFADPGYDVQRMYGANI